jgi:type II secretory pathway component PulF
MEAARQGAKLSEILAAHPECFEPWVAASVSAAERAGALDALLPVVVEDHRQVSRERARLTYPKVYAKAIAVLAVIAATLPLAITHGLGFWLVNTLVNGLPLLAIGLLAWHGLRLVGRLGPVQSLVERITSRLPVMGKGQRVAYARRFLRAYRDMVRAGCLPQEAMEAAASVAGPARLEARGMRAAEHLRRGGDLPTALAMAGVLDRKTRGLLETAEETGELDVMLDECLEMLDDEADRQSLRRSIWSWALLLLLTAVLVGAGVIVGVVGYYNRIMEFYDSFLTE